MELQKRYFWIWKWHIWINYPKEFESTLLDVGLKKSKFYKKCMSLLVILPPQNFAVFESQFLFKYFTQRAWLHNLLRFSTSLNVCSQFLSCVMSSLHKDLF